MYFEHKKGEDRASLKKKVTKLEQQLKENLPFKKKHEELEGKFKNVEQCLYNQQNTIADYEERIKYLEMDLERTRKNQQISYKRKQQLISQKSSFLNGLKDTLRNITEEDDTDRINALVVKQRR